ncbi:P-loop NTPase [soil metagenome]
MSVVVLRVASGADWEPEALRLLGDRHGIVVLKRCVDVADLLATAASGQAQVAVLGVDTPGLDAPAVDLLLRSGVRPVAVSGPGSPEAARARAARVGIAVVVGSADLASLPDVVTDVVTDVMTVVDASAAPTLPGVPVATPALDGRAYVVWGPAGAPGRSTVAAAVAGGMARRRSRTVLVDADPYGGTIAQQLGILDEVSGLLAAARLSSSGQLAHRFPSVQRGVDAHLSVVSGLPRPDRWVEVRGGSVEHLVEVARGHGDVVVDTGFCLEEDPAHDFGSRPGRNQLTLGALEAADEVLVVGAADPVGLSRLARGLAELRELVPGLPLRVVVNRMRSSLGWSEKQITAMVAGVLDTSAAHSLHFLPDDRAAVDRALVTGRTLLEGGDSVLTRAVAALVDGFGPEQLRPRTAGTARRR